MEPRPSLTLQEKVQAAWTSEMFLKYVEQCAYDAPQIAILVHQEGGVGSLQILLFFLLLLLPLPLPPPLPLPLLHFLVSCCANSLEMLAI